MVSSRDIPFKYYLTKMYLSMIIYFVLFIWLSVFLHVRNIYDAIHVIFIYFHSCFSNDRPRKNRQNDID
jgi:hypothetical protein